MAVAKKNSPKNGRPYHFAPLFLSVLAAGCMLVFTMVTGFVPQSPLSAFKIDPLSSSADSGAPKLSIVVNGATTATAQQGGGYEVLATYGGKPFSGKQLDAQYVVCSILNPDQCGAQVSGPWGTYTLDGNGKVQVNLGSDIPVGVYKAQFKPRAERSWQWSEAIAVTVYPQSAHVGSKAAYHRYSNLRAGMLQTSGGTWNVQDFAFHVVNPSNQNIDVMWKFTADDPNFVFTGGSKGTKTRVLPIDAAGYQSLNVAGPEIYPFEIPTYSNFTGSVEFAACLRGSNPCAPVKFYAYLLAQTPVRVGVDANKTWFDSWSAWRDQVPVGFDADLNAFIVPYTNYWHNVADWPEGWYSKLTLTNNNAATAVYTVKHVPDSYSARVQQGSGCGYQQYTVQTATVSVGAKASKTVDLQTLFGWSPASASYVEGYLVITAPQGVSAQTIVSSEVLPNVNGSSLCPSHNAWLATARVDSVNQETANASGVMQLSARIAQNRGTNITRVVFYVDNQAQGEGSVAQSLAFDSKFSLATNSLSSGVHQLYVKAFRGTEEVASSSAVQITVTNNTITYNGNDPKIKLEKGEWVNFTPLAGAYNNDEIYTGTAGATATLTVATASRFKVYGAKAYNRGKMEVFIDGVSKGVIDPYSASTEVAVLLFDSGQLTAGNHEIKLVNVSAQNTRPYIGLDKIVVDK